MIAPGVGEQQTLLQTEKNIIIHACPSAFYQNCRATHMNKKWHLLFYVV